MGRQPVPTWEQDREGDCELSVDQYVAWVTGRGAMFAEPGRGWCWFIRNESGAGETVGSGEAGSEAEAKIAAEDELADTFEPVVRFLAMREGETS